MKKNVFMKIFAVVFGCLFFVTTIGCKSTPIYLEDNSPVLILSVISNPRIPWDAESANSTGSDPDYDEEGSGLLSNLVGKIVGKNNPEYYTAQERVDYAAQALTDLFTITAGIEVFPHEDLKNYDSYNSIGTNYLNFLEKTMIATGYINNMQFGAKHARSLMEETDTKGIVMADFTFQKTIIRGTNYNGDMSAKVKMKVRVLGEGGKEIINKEFVSISPETIKVQKRKYNQDSFVALFQPTIDAVINQFLVNYIK